MTGISYEDQYTFFILSYTVLRLKNVSDKIVEKVKPPSYNKSQGDALFLKFSRQSI